MKKYQYFTRTFTLPDGTRKYIYGKTKAEAEAKLKEAKAAAQAGVNVNDDTTFADLAKLWIETYKAPYIRTSSLNTLRANVEAHLIPRFGSMKVKAITPLMCQNLLADLAKRNLSTTGVTIAHLRAILEVGVELGCLLRNPVSASLRAPQQPKKHGEVKVLPRSLEAETLQKLSPMSPEHIFFMVAKETGGRRGEIFALKWDCIDLPNGVIHFRRNLTQDENGKLTVSQLMKTETSRRSVPISHALHDTLILYAKEHGTTGFLLQKKTGEHYSLHMINSLMGRLSKTMSVIDPEYASHFTAHALRHTYITRLFEAGCDVKEVQKLAGHKDITTTLGLYTHYDEAVRQAETFDKVRGYLSAAQ